MRPAFDALFALDDAMADVVGKSTEPALGAIKLVWWRETLEGLDSESPPPEPRLQGAAAELLPRGISGAELAGLEDGWATLLDEQPDIERIGGRGATLFVIAGKLLGVADPLLCPAGRLYAHGDVARRQLAGLHWPIEEMQQLARHRFPRRLRPLTALARLAARDVKQAPGMEPEGTPARALALLAHRFTGRIG